MSLKVSNGFITYKFSIPLDKIVEQMEEENNVKVLFLIESGSRAWGWESEDSDYDVRGVFVQDYLKFTGLKDQIDKKVGDIDISLWDMRKFLSLMSNSNPTVWEWLSSEMIYQDHPIRGKLKAIYERDFSKYSLEKHYVSMARSNFYKYINRIGDKANYKKYLYILRCVGCVNWLEKKGTPPPKRYNKVIGSMPLNVRRFFKKVVKEKRASERTIGSRNMEVEKYLVNSFDRDFEKDKGRFDTSELNRLFVKASLEHPDLLLRSVV